MITPTPGIHHVTMIAGDPQANLDFYTKQLGLRLAKLTVNFDDPGSYHFYFGDALGTPGTALTFFPHTAGHRGRVGSGQTSAVALAVRRGSLDFWMNRLAAEAIHFEAPGVRFKEHYVSFQDPDGLRLELVESDLVNTNLWEGADVPKEHQIICVHSVTMLHRDSTPTGQLLEKLGFGKAGSEGNRTRYEANPSAFGHFVDLVTDPSAPDARTAVGSVHHVAFRTPNETTQKEWLNLLSQAGLHVSPVMERDYFQSIYFREPGGILFEIATDGPGMTRDESFDELGSGLRLPANYEPFREEISKALAPLRLPVKVNA